MIGLDDNALTELFQLAKASPRLRSHLLLHSSHDDPVQRLAIALRCGTYLRPHVHSMQWEMLTLLCGRADLLFFDGNGGLAKRTALAADASTIVQIPPQQVHSLVTLEDDSVVLEVKPGPYRPNEFMDWAPEEGATDAAALVDWMTHAKLGARWSPRS